MPNHINQHHNLQSLSFDQVTLSFNHKIIVQDFNAHINKGEFIGIFGPNGSGKTTLLRAILGLLSPSQGNIAVLGKPNQRGNPVIGYMPQYRSQIPPENFSGIAMVCAAMQGYRLGLPFISKKQKKQIDEVIELVGANEYAHRPFMELSGGEKQRLLLAQVMLDNPQILLLDEPLSNLDPNSQDNLISIIQHIQHQFGATVLFTAHDVNPLLGVMDRVLYMANGNAKIGTVADVITSEQLTNLYGVPIEVIQLQHRIFVLSPERGEVDHGTHCH